MSAWRTFVQRVPVAPAVAAVAVVLASCVAAVAAEKTYNPDLARCAGVSASDVAPLLGVPPEKVVAKAEKIHATHWSCTFGGGAGGTSVAFTLEVAKTPQAAAADLEQYRSNLEIAAETAPFKDRLPKGAWSEIGGDGLGDENVWTDVNGAFTARKGNVTVQVTEPGPKLEKIKVAKAVLAKL